MTTPASPPREVWLMEPHDSLFSHDTAKERGTRYILATEAEAVSKALYIVEGMLTKANADRDALAKQVEELAGLLREARAELRCSDDKGDYEFGHWCRACDEYVDRNRDLRVRIDGSLARLDGAGEGR